MTPLSELDFDSEVFCIGALYRGESVSTRCPCGCRWFGQVEFAADDCAVVVVKAAVLWCGPAWHEDEQPGKRILFRWGK